MTCLRLVVLALAALTFPPSAGAVPANRSIALEGALARRAGHLEAGLTLSAGWWLAGEVEAEARLTLWSAPAPVVRGAAGALTPEVGVRWAPDEGRWRPVLALALGARLPGGRQGAAATALVGGGVELLVAPGWAVGASAGLRWLAGAGAAWEAALGGRCYF